MISLKERKIEDERRVPFFIDIKGSPFSFSVMGFPKQIQLMFPMFGFFPFSLSVVEAFAYNGTGGDETALKRLGPCCWCFNVRSFPFSFLVDFLFLFASRISRLQTPSKLHLLSFLISFLSECQWVSLDTDGKGVATDVAFFLWLMFCISVFLLTRVARALTTDEFVFSFSLFFIRAFGLSWSRSYRTTRSIPVRVYY